MARWMLAPVTVLLDPHTILEHTPLGYYRYGEYPRFIRPVGAHMPTTELRLVTNIDTARAAKKEASLLRTAISCSLQK